MNDQKTASSAARRILITAGTALAGAAIFSVLQMPLPWLLGPMLAVLLGSNLWRGRYTWPGAIRNTGMILVGYTIGLSLTGAALTQMAHQLPSMLLMTLLLLLLCAGMAAVVARMSGIDYMTVLMGSIPGGLTQMILLAQESRGINITVVTVIQVTRLIMIISCVPFLIFSPLLGGRHGAASAQEGIAPAEMFAAWSGLLPEGLIFLAVCTLCAWAGERIRFPVAYLLGPVLAAAALQLAGLQGPALPTEVLGAAQLMIGAYVGLLLQPGQLPRKYRLLSLALLSGAVLLAGAFALSGLLTRLQPVSLLTSLLSLAPGGMDQMALIAHEVEADLSMVAGYQLFRMFFLFFTVPPVLRWMLKREADKQARAGKM